MRKIRVYVSYPWAGISDDECEFEVEDNATDEEIDDMANDAINDMVWNRLSGGWEEVATRNNNSIDYGCVNDKIFKGYD